MGENAICMLKKLDTKQYCTRNWIKNSTVQETGSELDKADPD